MKKVVNREMSEKLMQRQVEVQKHLENIVQNGIDMGRSKAISEANRLVYELAEKKGMSLWDVCLMCVPDYDYNLDTDGNDVSVECKIKLIPLEFDFSKNE